MKRVLLITVFVVCNLANAVEIQRWERIPLALPLIVGQERIVSVDQNIRVGLPRHLVDKLRVQSTGVTLYLLAKEPIEPTRLQLQNMSTGELMLVDIIATTGKANQPALEPMKIVVGDNSAARYGQPSPKAEDTNAATRSTAKNSDETPTSPRETPLPVVMTRYAAQMLYAPLRTVEPVPGIAQVNLKRRLDLTSGRPISAPTATATALHSNGWIRIKNCRSLLKFSSSTRPKAATGSRPPGAITARPGASPLPAIDWPLPNTLAASLASI